MTKPLDTCPVEEYNGLMDTTTDEPTIRIEANSLCVGDAFPSYDGERHEILHVQDLCYDDPGFDSVRVTVSHGAKTYQTTFAWTDEVQVIV